MSGDIVESWPLEHSEKKLVWVHSPDVCEGQPCTVHSRTDHSMRSFPQHWRSDRGIMERICPHGVGHPDPDSPWPEGSSQWIHGCDGCCQASVLVEPPPGGDEAAQQPWNLERLRAAGDALAEVADEWPELVAAWQEARRSAEDRADNRSALIDAHHVLTSERK